MGVLNEIPGTALTPMQNDHLDWLEAESIYIIREVVAECRNPALLFSGGKDSIVMLHLALKAFRLGDRKIELPFPLVHIDTGHNYPEVIAFRDQRVAELGARLVVGHVEDSIKRGTVRLRRETDSRNAAQAVTLLETIESHGFDALMGGARRDEEKARAKERIFSFRDEFGQWDPGPAPGALEPVQRPHGTGRADARVPDLQLDGARRVAVHRPREPGAAADLLRASA